MRLWLVPSRCQQRQSSGHGPNATKLALAEQSPRNHALDVVLRLERLNEFIQLWRPL